MQFPYALALLVLSVAAVPQLASRTDAAQPTFPASPPACYLCQPYYAQINTCAQAAVVFQNVSTVILNPGSFISTIQCACTDTFQTAYPQCADWYVANPQSVSAPLNGSPSFLQTNQTQFLGTDMDGVPKVVQGIRQICTLASVILGHPVSANGEASGQTPITVASPTSVAGSGAAANLGPTAILGLVGALSVLAGMRLVWL